jgi:EmrB/QacA subfamily drug resistance transporter
MTQLEQPTAREVGPAASGGPGGGLTVILTSLAYFMVTLDALVVVTALPSIHRDLGGSLGTLQWTANAYNMCYAAGIITAAALGDRLGRRRVFLAGLTLFTTASAACALAPSVGALIAFRAVQGIGAATVVPMALTLLTSAFPAERRGSAVGIWGGIAGLGVAAGPLIGGAVTQGLNWHWIFWINVPVGIVVVVGARLRLGESRGTRSRLDLPALVLVTAGIAAMVWGLVQGPQDGWGSARVAGSLALGAALVVAFLAWEARGSEPMIPLGLFRTGSFSAAAATQFLMAAAIFSAAFVISQFFQFAIGDTPLGTGLRFLPWTATPLLVAPAAGMLFDRVGARRLVIPGLVLQGLGFAWIVYLAGTAAGYGAYIAPFVIAGVGISMALPCVTTSGINAARPVWIGKAAGVMNMMQLLGATLGIAIITVVFNATGSLAGAATVTHGFRSALIVSAGLSVLGALTAVGIRSARKRPG